MTKNKIQRLRAILCAVAAAFCMVLGFINMPKQNGAAAFIPKLKQLLSENEAFRASAERNTAL